MSKNTPNNTLSDVLGATISREQAINLIKNDSVCYQMFRQIPVQYQESLITFLQGNGSLQITFDNFFLYLFDPNSHPKRVERFLSSILGESVKIKHILPRDGEMLSEKGSLVIMDIIAETIDDSIIDIEMQKVGYHFPSQRSSCYASDMIMRQYNHLKNEYGKNFSYSLLRPVYLIILMEKSAPEFAEITDHYIHKRQTSYTSGASLPELAKITYVSLDTFRLISHNIDTELDAWLTFLSREDSEHITELIEKYPFFLECYKDIAKFRTNPKELIYMYSEALSILDKNTELYMIDEMQKQIEAAQVELNHKYDELVQKSKELTQKNNELAHKKEELAHKDDELAQKDKEILALQKELAALRNQQK